MKNKTTFFFLALVSFLLFSCNKYPDGPGLSLLPRKWRLSGSWHVEQLLVNEQDMTNAYYPNHEYYENYEVGGAYSFSVGTSATSPANSGSWSWVEKRTKIFRSVSPSSPVDQTITILRLENKSLWYSYTSGSQTYEYHMVQD